MAQEADEAEELEMVLILLHILDLLGGTDCKELTPQWAVSKLWVFSKYQFRNNVGGAKQRAFLRRLMLCKAVLWWFRRLLGGFWTQSIITIWI